MRLVNTTHLGRYRHTENNRVVNMYRGRNMERSTDDNWFYYFRYKQIAVTPSNWEKIAVN